MTKQEREQLINKIDDFFVSSEVCDRMDEIDPAWTTELGKKIFNFREIVQNGIEKIINDFN